MNQFWERLWGFAAGLLTQQSLAAAGASPDALAGAVTGSVDLPTGYNRSAEEIRQRAQICAFAMEQLGKPYHLGVERNCDADSCSSSTGSDEWDCSELIEKSYGQAGLSLPDGSNFQYDFCRPVTIPQAGDLGFVWSEAWGRIGHVIMCLGDGTAIEARGKPYNVVRIIPMHDWESHPRWRGWRRHPDFAMPTEEV